jgi:hypothetical protein
MAILTGYVALPWGQRFDHVAEHPIDVLQIDLPADVQDRPTDVRGDHIQDALGHPGEPPGPEVGTHDDDRDGHAAQDVDEIAIEPSELGISRLQLVVDRRELLVDGLELLL